jgi:hypothetical protein
MSSLHAATLRLQQKLGMQTPLPDLMTAFVAPTTSVRCWRGWQSAGRLQSNSSPCHSTGIRLPLAGRDRRHCESHVFQIVRFGPARRTQWQADVKRPLASSGGRYQRCGTQPSGAVCHSGSLSSTLTRWWVQHLDVAVAAVAAIVGLDRLCAPKHVLA